MLNDFRRRGRVHRVYLIGVAVMFTARALTRVVPGTSAWQAFASWAMG